VYIFHSFLLPCRLPADFMISPYFSVTSAVPLPAVHMFLYLCLELIGLCL
jgi:hypothetical protein